MVTMNDFAGGDGTRMISKVMSTPAQPRPAQAGRPGGAGGGTNLARRRLAFAGCAGAVLASALGFPVATGAAATPQVVAEVGSATITTAEVEEVARERGLSARAALAALVAARLHEREAAALSPPPVRSHEGESNRALVQRLLEADFEPHARAEDVPDSVLRPLYERNRLAWVHPRLVRVNTIGVMKGAGRKDPAVAAAVRATAQELAAFVAQRSSRTPEDFDAIAALPEWNQRGVWVAKSLLGPNAPQAAELGAEAIKLTKPGDTTPLVEDKWGYYIARFVAEEPAKNVAFADARPTIAAAVHESWRKQRFLDYVDELSRRHGAAVTPAVRLTEAPVP